MLPSAGWRLSYLSERSEDVQRPLLRKTTRRFCDELTRIAKRDPLHETTEQVTEVNESISMYCIFNWLESI